MGRLKLINSPKLFFYIAYALESLKCFLSLKQKVFMVYINWPFLSGADILNIMDSEVQNQ